MTPRRYYQAAAGLYDFVDKLVPPGRTEQMTTRFDPPPGLYGPLLAPETTPLQPPWAKAARQGPERGSDEWPSLPT